MKKSKHNSIIVRTRKQCLKKDGSWIKFFSNDGIIVKKRTSPLGSEVFGPTISMLRRKRLLNSFPGIL